MFKIYAGSDQINKSGLQNGGLDIGIDLTRLSISFESKENLLDKLKSPFPSPNQTYSESFQLDYRIPACYNLSKPKQGGVKEEMIRNVMPDRVLMYIFYNMPNDK